MAQPLHTLKHEHRVIERGLRALDGVCIRLKWGEAVPFEAISQIVDFISAFADQYHHGKEENYLFPALERQGIPRGSGALAAMEQQHEIERELTAEMQSSLEQYSSDDSEARQRFIVAALKYTDFLTGHIDKEDALLFRIADEVLDDEDKDEIAASFKQAEAKLGAGGLERYEALAAELEKKWAI